MLSILILGTIYKHNKLIIPALALVLSLPATVEAADKEPASSDVKASDTPEATIAKEGDAKKVKCTRCMSRPMIGSLYMLGGVAFNDTDAIDGRLSRYGYTEWDTPAVSLGLGFTHRWGRLVTGVDWQWLLSSNFESSNGDLRMDAKNWYWQLTYGVDVVQWKGLSVYPLVGIGAGHTDIWIEEEAGQSFNSVLEDPARGTHMKQTSLLLSAGLGVDYRFKMKETERKTTFFTLGVRGGYMFQPYASDWRTHSAEINSGPDKAFQGANVQLLLGISGMRHKKK